MISLRVNRHRFNVGLLSFFAFLSTISSIRYVRMIIPFATLISYVAIFITSLGSIILFVNRKKSKISNRSIICWLFLIYLITVTVFIGNNVTSGIVQLAPVICCCLLITAIETKENLEIVLKMWRNCFTALLLLDVLSMLLHPTGLYRGDSAYYDINWFLGFKTERLYYLLPLVIIVTYQKFTNNEKLSVKTLIIYGLVFGCTLFSDATAGSITLLIYMIVVPFMEIYTIKIRNIFAKILTKIVTLLTNFYTFSAVYIFIFISVVVVQSNSFLINAVAELTNKNITFSGRMIIWTRCVNFISKHFLFGSGLLNTTQYQSITFGYNNPHNILLTYLISGGIIGFALLMISVYLGFRVITVQKSKICLVLGIVVFFILGITSSALAFCPFFFALLMVLLESSIES